MAGTAERVLERIESDHQDLLRQLADLRATLRAGISAGVTDALRYVCLYIDAHFAREEREMIETRYPRFQVHRAAHRQMAREVRAFEVEWARTGVTPALADGFLSSLSSWIELHVLELDAELVRHLAASRVRVRRVGWPSNVIPLSFARR